MLDMYPLYPDQGWQIASAHEADFDPFKLERAKSWLDRNAKTMRYRVVIVRKGRLVANWNNGFGLEKKSSLASIEKLFISRIPILTGRNSSTAWNPVSADNLQLPLASAAKFIFSCILGIVIEEGKMPSADAKIVDYFPEANELLSADNLTTKLTLNGISSWAKQSQT